MGTLDGKVALITGTAAGMGRVAALIFAREGAQVVGADIQVGANDETVELVRRVGGEMTGIAPVDLTDPDAVRQLAEDAAAAYGGLDVVYNNAAMQRFGPMPDFSVEDWRATEAGELDIPFFVSKFTWPHLVRDVLRFFTTASPTVFGVNFDNVDMVDLLTQPETKQLLRDAQTHAEVSDYPMAMAGLVLAFDALLTYYAKVDKPSGSSPFRFGPPLYPLDEPRVDGQNGRANARLKKLTEFSQVTQEALRVMSLGIDYASVARFRVIAPRVHGFADGSKRFVNSKSVQALAAEDYDWARHFVIESALRASRADQVRLLQEQAFRLDWNPSEPVNERSWTGPAADEVSAPDSEIPTV